jgi:hypothetical protein
MSSGPRKRGTGNVARVCPFLNHAADWSTLLPLIQRPPKLMNAAVHHPYRGPYRVPFRVGRFVGFLAAFEVLELRAQGKRPLGAGWLALLYRLLCGWVAPIRS